MKILRYILPIGLLAGALGAQAQDLSTEITVDRTVLPEQRLANKPTLLPSLLSIESEDVRLIPAEYSENGRLTSLVTTLPAAPWRSVIERTPYRGYVSASYFPKLNVSINAGYRIVDTDRLTVGAWTQGNARRYSYDGVRIQEGFGSAGLYAAYKVNDNSRLAADIHYTLASISHPMNQIKQNHRVGDDYYYGRLQWESRPSTVSYNLSVGYNCFNMGDIKFKRNDLLSSSDTYNYKAALGQSAIEFAGGVGVSREGELERWLGVDVDACWLSTNHGYGNQAQYHVAPYARWHNDQLSASIGVNLSLASGDDNPSQRIAPKVRFAYAPQGSKLSAWLSITGGEHLNRLYDQFMKNYYISPYVAYVRTNIPVDIEAAVTLGRFYGISIEAFGGYAVARNMLLPMLWRTEPGEKFDWQKEEQLGPQWMSIYGGPTMQGYDANCWHAGLRLSYAYQSYGEIEVSAETAGSDSDLPGQPVTWISWIDRAKYVINGTARIFPTDKLDITIGYEFRGDRHLPIYNGYWNDIDLEDMVNLSLGGAYRITPKLTAMITLENLFNRHSLDTASLPTQGFHGLVGIAYKF